MLTMIVNHEGPSEKKSIVNLIKFTSNYCSGTLRQAWESAMELCGEPGSLKRCMLALLFIKATNGVADAVTVPYFKEIARRMADENDPLYSMTLKDLTRPEYVARLHILFVGWLNISLIIKVRNFRMMRVSILHFEKWVPKVCPCLCGQLFERMYGWRLIYMYLNQ